MPADERVPKRRGEEIRRRLREVRGSVSLRRAAKSIEETSVARAHGLKVDASDVRRFEGGDPKRDTLPTEGYVRAVAEAFSADPDYLLADDILGWTLEDITRLWHSREALVEAQQPRGADPSLNRLRLRIQFALAAAANLPIQPNIDPRRQLVRDRAAAVMDDLERLFWEAFANRGLTEDQLIRKAIALGRVIPTPPRLPAVGFLPPSDVSEDRLWGWWLHTVAGLRMLLQPGNQFRPEDLDLGLQGEGGYPLAWEEVTRTWEETPEMSDEEILSEVLRGPPA